MVLCFIIPLCINSASIHINEWCLCVKFISALVIIFPTSSSTVHSRIHYRLPNIHATLCQWMSAQIPSLLLFPLVQGPHPSSSLVTINVSGVTQDNENVSNYGGNLKITSILGISTFHSYVYLLYFRQYQWPPVHLQSTHTGYAFSSAFLKPLQHSVRFLRLVSMHIAFPLTTTISSTAQLSSTLLFHPLFCRVIPTFRHIQ